MTEPVQKYREQRVMELSTLVDDCLNDRRDIAAEMNNILRRIRELYFFNSADMRSLAEHLVEVSNRTAVSDWSSSPSSGGMADQPWYQLAQKLKLLLEEPPLYGRDWSRGPIEPQFPDALTGRIDLAGCARYAQETSTRRDQIDPVTLLTGTVVVFRAACQRYLTRLQTPESDHLNTIFDTIVTRDDVDLAMFPNALTYLGDNGVYVHNQLTTETDDLRDELRKRADRSLFDTTPNDAPNAADRSRVEAPTQLHSLVETTPATYSQVSQPGHQVFPVGSQQATRQTPSSPLPDSKPHWRAALRSKRRLFSAVAVVTIAGLLLVSVVLWTRGKPDEQPTGLAATAVKPAIPVGDTPVNLTLDFDHHQLFVANKGGNTISVIDTTTDTVTSTIPIGIPDYAPSSLAIDPTTRLLYVAAESVSTIAVIDTVRGRMISTIELDGADPTSIAIDPDTHILYVADFNAQAVASIDTRKQKVIALLGLPGGRRPWGVEVDSGLGVLYVTDSIGEFTDVIDLVTNRVTATMSAGSGGFGAVGIAIDPATHTGYLAGPDLARPKKLIQTFDGSTHTLGTTIPLERPPRCIAFDPSAHILYAMLDDDAMTTVTVIDTNTDRVLAHDIAVGVANGYLTAMIVDPETHTVYAVGSAGNSVVVLKPL